MPVFSYSSKQKLATCHPDLQRLMNEVIQRTDIMILCGHRGQADQDAAYRNGTSKLQWPHGKHNTMPSNAVDVAPYPLNWDNVQGFRDTAKIIKQVAAELNIPVKWGGDWKSWKDFPHWEL